MAKERCTAGKGWDNLVKSCVKQRPRPEVGATTVRLPVFTGAQTRSPSPTAETTKHAPPDMTLSLALWVVVMLTTLGSVLALLLWFILYRRRRKSRSALEAMEPGQEPLQKMANGAKHHPPPPLQGHAVMQQRAAAGGGGGDPSPFPQLHYGPQAPAEQEESYTSCWDPTLHTGAEEGGGLPGRNPLREHRIPLPATELGGTALVTTKTV